MSALLTTEAAISGQIDEPISVINAINYGYVFYQQNTVEIIDMTARLTFAIELPERQAIKSIDGIQCKNNVHNSICRRFTSVIDNLSFLYVRLQNNLAMHIDDIYRVIENFDNDDDLTTRSKRAWIPVLGNLIKTIAGVSTMDDINSVRHTISHLQNLLINSSKIFTNGQNDLFSSIKIESARISNLAELIKNNHDEIKVTYDQIKDIVRNNDELQDIIALVIEKIANFTISINSLNVFRQSIETLLTGKLTPDLISHQTLLSSLDNLRQHLILTNSKYRIINNHLHHYYINAYFSVLRQNNSLIILIDCPLTLNRMPLTMYKFKKLPLHLQPSSDSVFSELSVDFDSILYHTDENRYFILDSHIQITDHMWNPHLFHIVPLSQEIPTCYLALITRDVISIRKLCIYHVTSAILSPFILPLDNNQFFLSNISHVLSTCVLDNSEFLPDIQSVLQLQCGCSAKADVFYIQTRDCTMPMSFNSNISIKHIVNLPLLHLFFADDLLMSFRPDSILRHKVNISIPRFTISENTFRDKIGIEQTHKYELDKLVNKSISNEQIFGQLSHYIYDSLSSMNSELLPENFNIFSFKDWILTIVTLTSLICIILIIILAYKLKNLALILATVHSVKAQQIPTALIYTTLSTPSTRNVTSPVSLTCINANLLIPVLIICGLICILFAFYLLRKHRDNELKTQVFIEIGNKHVRQSIPLFSLPHPPQFYIFNVNDLTSSASISSAYLFRSLAFKLDNVILTHRLLNTVIDIPTSRLISICKTRVFSDILASDYYLVLRVTDWKETEIIVIKHLATTDQLPAHTSSAPHIYPSLCVE